MFHSLFFSFSFQLMKFELIFVCPYFVDSGEKGASSPIAVYPAMDTLHMDQVYCVRHIYEHLNFAIDLCNYSY